MTSLTGVFAAGTIGIVIGSFVVGPLADRYGRRWFLLAATLIFALATLGPTLDLSFSHLVAYRLVTGLGLGAATPSAIALTAEYAPERHRSLLNNLMFAGFPVGGLLAASSPPSFCPTGAGAGCFISAVECRCCCCCRSPCCCLNR
jgi:AAHS family 4-hydroxybenzoate transporter-like MFS transporter